jgi:hypothetical protein
MSKLFYSLIIYNSMKDQNKEHQRRDNENPKNPINQAAKEQQTGYGSKLDVQTEDYDIESEPGYENHLHPNAGAATDKVVAGGSGEKLLDLSKIRTQETVGGENQLKEEVKSLQDNNEGVAVSLPKK